jgi:hypothetical protein
VQRDEMRQAETDAGTPKTHQEHTHQVDPILEVFVDIPEAVPSRIRKLHMATEFAEEVRVMLRDDKPPPSEETTRNIATVRATPKHFKDHEARWKQNVKGYNRRAGNERESEADITAGVGGDEADASGRAFTTLVSVPPWFQGNGNIRSGTPADAGGRTAANAQRDGPGWDTQFVSNARGRHILGQLHIIVLLQAQFRMEPDLSALNDRLPDGRAPHGRRF